MTSKRFFLLVGLLVLAVVCGGCNWLKTDERRFLAPYHLVDSPDRSPVMPILTGLSPLSEHRVLPPEATFPTEGDWTYTDEDYVVGPTDVLDISIIDLFTEGMETVLRREVSTSGYVDLPLLPESYAGTIRAEGRTATELRQAIADAYSPEVLRDPTISVTVVARRQNTFSVMGAVARPGQYNIIRKDTKLLQALSMAGGITQTNIKYIYVIRQNPAAREKQVQRRAPGREDLPPLPEIPDEPANGESPVPDEPVDDVERRLRELGGSPSGAAMPRLVAHANQPGAAGDVEIREDSELSGAAPTYKWVYSNGRWIRVAQEMEATEQPPEQQPMTEAQREDPFGWRKAQRLDDSRLIAINLEQLRQGKDSMNIIIRDNDVINVPPLEVGEFYVQGEVLRPGVYSLTGRDVTIKMAITAAGGFSVLAWPENTILVRRTGAYQEQIIPLNLEKIWHGEDPDVYLKANDLLAVGTDARASFFAVIRNAFRMTYGFGFIYDRNFADPYEPSLNSNRFSRW
jgi:protein involved in polysaccharide export with SLBB domain